MRPVGKNDDGRIDVGSERLEAAPERGSRPALPVRAAHEPRRGIRLKLVRALHDDDLVHGGLAKALEHTRQENPLLGAPESGRLAGGEDDRSRASHQLSSTVTLEITTGWEGGPSPTPSASIRMTVSMPSVTSPTIA